MHFLYRDKEGVANTEKAMQRIEFGFSLIGVTFITPTRNFIAWQMAFIHRQTMTFHRNVR